MLATTRRKRALAALRQRRYRARQGERERERVEVTAMRASAWLAATLEGRMPGEVVSTMVNDLARRIIADLAGR